MKLLIDSNDAALLAAALDGVCLPGDLGPIRQLLKDSIEKAAKIEALRAHPFVVNGKYSQDLEKGVRKLRFCPGCPDLVAWSKASGSFCHHCGAKFRDLGEMLWEQYQVILKNIDETWALEDKRRKLDLTYPVPLNGSPCRACGGPSHAKSETDSGYRPLTCSDECTFRWIGRQKPEGRKWTGFLTMNPHLKGGVVRYLGVLPLELTWRKPAMAECYWWKIDPKDRMSGQIYAYFSDSGAWGEKGYLCASAGTSQPFWAAVRKAAEGSVWTDESWRVIANVLTGWEE